MISNQRMLSFLAGNHSPAHSDAATTTRASSVSEHHNNTTNHTGTMGKINRAYQRYIAI